MASPTTRISLAPSPGFCIKSTSLNQVSLSLPTPAQNASSSALTIPANLKVFINIAWDKHVPPPPDASEAAIERAIAGDIALDPSASDPADWFVPVIVSEPRQDKDKAGKPSVVFDCIFNSSLKSRSLRSPEFKTFLIELAFQRIEAQWGLQLSRQIGTPNIASKGKLPPRSVLVPTALLSPALSPSPSSSSSAAAATAETPAAAAAKPLIEELGDVSTPEPKAFSSGPPKSILKNNASPSQAVPSPTPRVPDLSWSKTDDGRLRIVLSVPQLTRESIPNTTLDLEPRRLIFSSNPPSTPSSVPHYTLDLDLSLPDSQITKVFAASSPAASPSAEQSAQQALLLKRERPLDVDGARAEWRVAEGLLVLYA
ncbi:pre-RNA processing PIH1/Nop17-domain-containing protein [Cubamyces lactineus]|nr:pre-RNA processing PIH1/Nop17-domain-containing protein [Cubamyces lactineus]